jgi:hypothetical protein
MDSDCLVTNEAGLDITNQVRLWDNDRQAYTIQCHNHQDDQDEITIVTTSSCQGAVIQDCPTISCLGNGACVHTQIWGFTQEVICQGDGACHHATIQGADQFYELGRSVTCHGIQACAHADIQSGSESMDVTCYGSSACVHADIEAGGGTITCQQGTADENNDKIQEACGISTIVHGGLVDCGPGACDDTFLQEDDDDDDDDDNDKDKDDSNSPVPCSLTTSVGVETVELDGTMVCDGTHDCQGGVIRGCAVVKCLGLVSCAGTTISGFTDQVICQGQGACHGALIDDADEPTTDNGNNNDNQQRMVLCESASSCLNALITSGSAMDITCFGPGACEDATLDAGTGSVHCSHHDSDDHDQNDHNDDQDHHNACQGSVQITAEHVVCGWNGCSDGLTFQNQNGNVLQPTTNKEGPHLN